MARLTVHPFGARITITSDDDRVFAAARAALARYPGDGGLDLTVELTASTLAVDEPTPWPTVSVKRTDHGIVVRCGESSFECNHAAGTAALRLTPAALACPDAVRMFVEVALWSPAIDEAHLFAVHSGLVRAAGAGLLLRGQSGAGKSTLSYSCLRRGMNLVSDDWVYAVAADGPGVLWGYPWRMWMTIDAALRFPELDPSTAVPHPGADRIKVPVIPPASRRRARSTVDAVVLLDPSEDLLLREARPGEALERFSVSALDSERGSLPAAFVDALLDRPCFVLQRGTSPEAAAGLLHDLTRRLGRDTAVNRPYNASNRSAV